MLAAPAHMTVTKEETADCRASVVSVAGDIDWANSGELHEAINQALNKSRLAWLVVDLKGVTRIDSAGLGTLLDVLQQAKHKSVRFVICGLASSRRRML